MTWPQRFHPDDSARAFLVERYVSAGAAQDLAAASARVARLCVDSEHTDTAVRYLYSAYLPTDDTCFCLFRAPSASAVRALNGQAHFAFDRVSDAALIACTDDGARLGAPKPQPTATTATTTRRTT